MRRMLLLVLLAPAIACGGDSHGDVDFGGEDLGPNRFAIESREGEVMMGLTDRYVYFGVTDSTAAAARAEMEAEMEGKEGLGGLVGGIVSKAVGKAIGMRMRYPIEDIQDIRWHEGEMQILFTEGGRRLDENVLRIDDRPVTEAFDREQVEAFAEAFREVKAGG